MRGPPMPRLNKSHHVRKEQHEGEQGDAPEMSAAMIEHVGHGRDGIKVAIGGRSKSARRRRHGRLYWGEDQIY